MSNVVAIIQARMGSTRLPRKILVEVRTGVPMLAEVISRVWRMRTVRRVVVAFPRPDEHEPARDVALFAGAEVFAPPPDVHENDVLTRYALAARQYNADVVVRATCDCALFDPVLGDEVVAAGGDWRVNDYVRGRRAIEAFPVDVLMRADRRATRAYDREHVTPWMYSTAAANTCAYIDDERPNWSVDTQSDLAVVREVLAKDPAATWRWNDGR